MIQLDNDYLEITKCERKIDKKGHTYLKCKGFTKGNTSKNEKETLEYLGKDYRKFVKGANFFSSINIYGKDEQLDILEQKFREKMDEVNEHNDKASGYTKQQRMELKLFKQPKVFKFYAKGLMFLRTYLLFGTLLSCIYVFNYEWADRKPKNRPVRDIATLMGIEKEPKKPGRPLGSKEKKPKNKALRGKSVKEKGVPREDGIITSKVITSTHQERFEEIQSQKRKVRENKNKIKEIEKETKLPKSDFVSEIDMLEQLFQETQNNANIESFDNDLENKSNEE